MAETYINNEHKKYMLLIRQHKTLFSITYKSSNLIVVQYLIPKKLDLML